MAKVKVICTCNGCGSKYDKTAVGRSLGKLSNVYLLNYCSAYCYTKAMTKEN